MGGRKHLPTDITSETARPPEAGNAVPRRASHVLFRLLFRALLALPPKLLLRIARQQSRVVEGRRLDPRLQFHAWFVQRFRKPIPVSPAELRKPRLLSLYLLDGKVAPVSIEERSIPGAGGPLRVRIYRPTASADPRPVLVYFHFGGCVLGDLDTCHTACSRLARESDVIVISTQYRLAPEHKFPAAVEDAVTAYRWARQFAGALGGDARRVGVGGDSAGGYLAAAVCLLCRDSGELAPTLQLLVYPVTDMDRIGMPEGAHDAD
jgi:acetyl esterase